jgi:hypothetical protein
MRGENIRNAIKAMDKALRANKKYLKFLCRCAEGLYKRKAYAIPNAEQARSHK